MYKILDKVDTLCENLKKNPKVEYIKWPHRHIKIQEFQAELNSIVSSETEK